MVSWCLQLTVFHRTSEKKKKNLDLFKFRRDGILPCLWHLCLHYLYPAVQSGSFWSFTFSHGHQSLRILYNLISITSWFSSLHVTLSACFDLSFFLSLCVLLPPTPALSAALNYLVCFVSFLFLCSCFLPLPLPRLLLLTLLSYNLPLDFSFLSELCCRAPVFFSFYWFLIVPMSIACVAAEIFTRNLSLHSLAKSDFMKWWRSHNSVKQHHNVLHSSASSFDSLIALLSACMLLLLFCFFQLLGLSDIRRKLRVHRGAWTVPGPVQSYPAVNACAPWYGAAVSSWSRSCAICTKTSLGTPTANGRC